jgi:hypothetical protein
MAKPRDNIDLDVMDAQRLGYGVHYGNYKADHPYTAAANEARLQPARKPSTTTGAKLYKKVCPVCNRQFTAQRKDRKYCSDRCQYMHYKTGYKHRAAQKEKRV